MWSLVLLQICFDKTRSVRGSCEKPTVALQSSQERNDTSTRHSTPHRSLPLACFCCLPPPLAARPPGRFRRAKSPPDGSHVEFVRDLVLSGFLPLTLRTWPRNVRAISSTPPSVLHLRRILLLLPYQVQVQSSLLPLTIIYYPRRLQIALPGSLSPQSKTANSLQLVLSCLL